MNTPSVSLLAAGCLILGFAAGWQLHRQPTAKSPVAPVTIQSTGNSTIATPEKGMLRTTAAPEIIITAHAASPSVVERLSTLRWMKSNGLSVGIPFFNSDGLTQQFVTLYDLTPAETARINQSLQQAKLRLDELIQQKAQRDPSSSNEKLIITVPEFPIEGGQVYSNLLTTFSTVLGNERYTLFNELSGDALERDWESFGMATSRYEVTLGTMDGSRIYNLNRSFSFADGRGRGTTWSTLDAQNPSGASKAFPVLKNFPLPTVTSTGSK